MPWDEDGRYASDGPYALMPAPNPSGFCQCGCGERTSRAERTRADKGHVRGEHVRFRPGHNCRGEGNPNYGADFSGPNGPNWKGGRNVDPRGYVRVWNPDHPRADKCYVHEHVLVAEAALGKHLPEGAQVHHVNEDRSDNRNRNLVVCQDQSYHQLLHARMRSRAA